jgi:hypothetical protein
LQPKGLRTVEDDVRRVKRWCTLCPSPTILVGGDRKEREGKGGYVMYPPTFKKGPYHTAVLDFANQKRKIREKRKIKRNFLNRVSGLSHLHHSSVKIRERGEKVKLPKFCPSEF